MNLEKEHKLEKVKRLEKLEGNILREQGPWKSNTP